MRISFQGLRNKFVTYKNNPNIEKWEIETPKDVRAGAIKDMCDAHTSAFSNLRNGNISSFKLGYRTKRYEASISIPHTSILKSNSRITIFKSYPQMEDGIKLSKDKCLKNISIEHDCRLKYDSYTKKWYMFIPIKKQTQKKSTITDSICSLDPGNRKFQTIYSEQEILTIRAHKLKTLQHKLDKLQSLRTKKINGHKMKRRNFRRRYHKIQDRVSNLIDDMHYKTIDYLTSNFSTVFIPQFESQKLVSINKSKGFRRSILTLKHFRFRERLIHKGELRHCNIVVCKEDFTTKTCSSCGYIYDIGKEEIYRCKNCHLCADRDINASKNIFMKTLLNI